MFEEFGFQSCLRVPAATLAQRAHCRDQPGIAANRAACGLVVDAGFSFTHVVPVFDGHAIPAGTRRINIGGKLLTNYLKELVSYRCIALAYPAKCLWNVHDQSFLGHISRVAPSKMSIDIHSSCSSSK